MAQLSIRASLLVCPKRRNRITSAVRLPSPKLVLGEYWWKSSLRQPSKLNSLYQDPRSNYRASWQRSLWTGTRREHNVLCKDERATLEARLRLKEEMVLRWALPKGFNFSEQKNWIGYAVFYRDAIARCSGLHGRWGLLVASIYSWPICARPTSCWSSQAYFQKDRVDLFEEQERWLRWVRTGHHCLNYLKNGFYQPRLAVICRASHFGWYDLFISWLMPLLHLYSLGSTAPRSYLEMGVSWEQIWGLFGLIIKS